jgi:DnaJ-class molecular chaperone
LTISQAALGTKKTIETIWNKKDIIIEPGTQDGSKVRLRGEVTLILKQGIKKGLLD